MAEVPEDTGYTNVLGGQLINSMSKSDSSDSLGASPHSHDSDFDEPWLAQVSNHGVDTLLVVLSTHTELASSTARGRSYWETGQLKVKNMHVRMGISIFNRYKYFMKIIKSS